MNRVKLAVQSHFEPLLWGKVANQVKLLIPSHSEPLQWEKIGKVANQAKLATPSHSEPHQWYHLVVWSPSPWNRLFVVGSFGYFHLVVWSQFAFGSLPPPPPLELIICSW